MFWLALGLLILWGLAGAIGSGSVAHRILSVVVGAELIVEAALLSLGILDSPNAIVGWLRAGGDTYLARKPAFVWRLYGLFFGFLGFIVFASW